MRHVLAIASAVLLAASLGAGETDAPISIENDALRFTLDPRAGGFSVLDKQAGTRWATYAGHGRIVMRDLAPMGVRPGLTFETTLPAGGGKTLEARVTVTLPKGRRDVHWAIEADADATMNWLPWPPPLVPEKGESWIVFAPYCDGLLLPLRRDGMPRNWWPLDMPFFGILAGRPTGPGYALILETPDDARLLVRATSKAKDAPMTAGVTWAASLGKWGYTRKLLYRFCPTGGYVALAKAYRQHAKDTGLLVTLREKMKRRPAIAKLAGAPDVWGAKGVAFCREAKAAGIDRMIVNGSFGVDDTEAIKKLGYLVSSYDNYEDMMAGKPGRYGDCTIPDDAPLMANGKRMLGWPVHVKDPKTGKTQLDPKTGKPILKEQFHKRCSARALQVAKRWVPPDQLKNPRDARFIDVATATELRECLDPNHRCTRSIDRDHKIAVARYIGEDLGLVVGGEHGKWWGVPYHDYWEGMQSGGFYSWPAGHVGHDIPQTRDAIGEKYLAYGIGHRHRIPLWELVFGDCVVSTWYWGDSTGHLHNADPDIARRKDLFNMLYGTVPLYWVSRPFSFRWDKPELRARLLDSYRTTCKLHEQLAFDELLTHEWLTPDRTVQKTTFSSGTLVVVNFGPRPYPLKDEGKTWLLSPLGFYARGPRILQYRVRDGERLVTCVGTPNYLFADGGGGSHDFGVVLTSKPVTLRRLAGDVLRFSLGRDPGRVVLRPGRLAPRWDLASTHVLVLDKQGRRVRELAYKLAGRGGVAFETEGRFEMVCGREHDLPNLVVDGLRLEPEAPKQGRPLTVSVTITNRGRTSARDVPVAIYLDRQAADTQLATRSVSVGAGERADVGFSVDTSALDGPRALVAVADPDGRVPELLEIDNVDRRGVTIALDPARWAYRLKIEVVNGPVEQPTSSVAYLKDVEVEGEDHGKPIRVDELWVHIFHGLPVALAVDFSGVLRRLGAKGALDPASIRVCGRTVDGVVGDPAFCQFDPASGFDATTNAKGAVVWLVHGTLRPRERRAYWLLFDVAEKGLKSWPQSRLWDPASNAAATACYRARLDAGCLVQLGSSMPDAPEEPFLSSLVYSSEQTGWVREEGGEALEQTVLTNGPVRAVVRVRKKLKAGLVYTKTYTFWPYRIDVQFEGNKAYGLMSRAYYALPGTYEDSAGNKAKVDGAGDAEGVLGKCPNPKWYVVYGDGWAHSCVALSKFDNITYWDAGHWGGIGFQGGDIKGARMTYVIHGTQKDGSFGKRDYERLMNPPKARIVE
ncbi:MAG: hypothetical protein ISS72_06525 [Candidatus Brocadiae bacterium]|nr:hypothetical protein [Candidatus Brocadiia bacterium]